MCIRDRGTHDEGHIRDQGETIHIRVLTIRVAGNYKHKGTHDEGGTLHIRNEVCVGGGTILIRVLTMRMGVLLGYSRQGWRETTAIKVLTKRRGLYTSGMKWGREGTIHIRVFTVRMGVLYTLGYSQ